MDPEESTEIIEAAGGDAAFARLLGLDSGKFVQRVNNWRRRGLPAAVVVAHYQTIQQLRRRVERRNTRV